MTAPAKARFEQLLAAEGATYNWLWQVVRNVKWFWPCSRGFGGAGSFLVPAGWEMVGSDAAAPGLPAGLYTMPEDGVPHPIMAILRQRVSGQLVVAVRGTNTRFEWARNFMYNRTAAQPFPISATESAALPGETHAGFTRGFEALWPHVRAALEAEVLGGGGGGGGGGGAVTSITFAGHSQGAAIAALLSFAAQKLLDARKAKLPGRVGLVAFGCPNVGDAAFVAALRKAVNARRVTFEHDPVALLPCASSAADKAASMPACADTPVATSGSEGREYWAGYKPLAGEIFIRSAAMTVQGDAWRDTSHISLSPPNGMIAAVHSCPYVCYFRRFSSGDPRHNHCLLKREPEGGGALAANGYCFGFPDDASPWPAPANDRPILTDSSVFPAPGARPPLWDFRSYDSARAWSCATTPNNMRAVEVRHGALPGVTPDMMVW
ncbi:MAG: Alpha/Beta hydrolase protein [Monoraphidium minutum]|nr:MAG: Alpha/Beta hydrolase protein [Monoraphidium minutum]